MPAPRYVHPQSCYSYSRQRFRRRIWLALACLAVAAVGAAATLTPSGTRKSDAATVPAYQGAESVPTVAARYPAIDPQPTGQSTPAVDAGKSYCAGPGESAGRCIAFPLPKVRMVRVPRASLHGAQAGSSRPGVAVNSRAAGPDQRIADSKSLQRSTHRQRYRRNPPHAYASRQQTEYRRQDFARGFW